MLRTNFSSLYKGAFFIITFSLLFGCQTTSIIQPATVGKTTAEDILIARHYEEDQQWDQALEMYRYMAQQSQQPDKSRYLQKAALILYKAGRFTEIEPFYESLQPDDLLENEQQHKNILLAGTYFEKGKIYQALGNLPDIDSITDPAYKVLALNIRSRGVLAIGNPLEAARLRIQITQYLTTEFEQRQNDDFIWDALNRMSEPNIINTLSKEISNDLRGWLELNLIARRSNMIPAKIEPWLQKWSELYSGHQANNYFVEKLRADSQLIFINPTHIALMLPFDDKFRNVSEAIQNGFLHAYYKDPDEKPILEIINVSSNPQDFYLQYNQAIQNGADFIVGPLDKKLVNELLLNQSLKVPTLTLNYADNDSYGVNNLYQFGLRPEDEAEQIADYALVNAHYHAITLTPDTSLGDRLKNAFSQRFESLGGQVVDSARYPAANNDYSSAIKNLLNINDSDSRHKILDRVLNRHSEFIPRRRQDVDMVFISGNARQARLIKPQLKFHHAKDLQVYATSSISSSIPDPDANRDLDEIQFVDTPWTLNSADNPEFQEISKLWPVQSQRYAKFIALGIDAYKVIPSLRRLMLKQIAPLPLNTGKISVDKNGRIHRELILATYQRGKAEVIKQSVDTVE
jgi:uncharacterized protein